MAFLQVFAVCTEDAVDMHRGFWGWQACPAPAKRTKCFISPEAEDGQFGAQPLAATLASTSRCSSGHGPWPAARASCYAQPATLKSDLCCGPAFEDVSRLETRDSRLNRVFRSEDASIGSPSFSSGMQCWLDNAGKSMKPLKLVHACSSQWPELARGHGCAFRSCQIQEYGRVSERACLISPRRTCNVVSQTRTKACCAVPRLGGAQISREQTIHRSTPLRQGARAIGPLLSSSRTAWGEEILCHGGSGHLYRFDRPGTAKATVSARCKCRCDAQRSTTHPRRRPRRAASEAVCVRSAATARSLWAMTTRRARARSVKLSGPPRTPMPGRVWLERPGEEATCCHDRKLHTSTTTTSRCETLATPAPSCSCCAVTSWSHGAGMGRPPVLVRGEGEGKGSGDGIVVSAVIDQTSA
ncbi:hypothetical protein DE146DRAFT_777009 [Phaeosphaeria sp. MPI-PUGE-AT-0046c]|nr:hypothetical protein DE146DRAFT_777009 [Phaeosphaeria sp. MPI-PUGE-AT-0046c]